MVSRSPIGRAVSGLEPWLQLALFLLHTRKQRGEWHPYVASLPQPETPLSWPEEDLDLLQGTQLYSTLMGYRCALCAGRQTACLPEHTCRRSLTRLGRRQFFEGLFAKLDAKVFSRDRATFDAEHFSYPGLVWAIQLVRSHVHKPLEGKDVALVPIADLVRLACCQSYVISTYLHAEQGSVQRRPAPATLDAALLRLSPCRRMCCQGAKRSRWRHLPAGRAN